MGEIVEYITEDGRRGDRIHHRCQPLHLDWLSGFNPRVPLLNVSSNRERRELVLATANVLLFYYYDGDREKILPVLGHKSHINMIGCDGSGRFVVSSDTSYSINVWDRDSVPVDDAQSPLAIRTIFEPFKGTEINAVAMSHEGKFLLAGGGAAQCSQLKIWSWTVGNDFPDDTIALPARLGRIKALRFCVDRGRRNQFVVTMESCVVFGAWDAKEQKLSIQVPKRHGFQDYNDSVFVEGTDRAVSVTGAGMAILWSDDRKAQPEGAGGTLLRKEFLKYLHLKYASINVVRSCDEKIVTGDDDGEIRFYDNSMKILYWFKQEDLEPIRTLSFELSGTRQMKKVARDNEPISVGEQSTTETEHEKQAVELPIEEIAPKDVSFDAKPVIVRGFVSATKSGKIYDIDIVYNKIQELFLPSSSIITAVDVHPIRSELCTCDGNGRMVIYDLKTKTPTKTLDVPIQRTRRGRITTLAYSPCGTFLAGGAENGYLWMIEPSVMILSANSPLQFSNEKLRMIMFSGDSKHLVCVEELNNIAVLQREKDSWKTMGRCASHKVVDLTFLNVAEFVSIGEDRHMVQYSIAGSEQTQLAPLAIVKRRRIEQSALPTAMLLLPVDQLLVANDQLKFKLFNAKTFEILHTFLGPFHDGPARCLRLLPGETFFLFTTNNNIYLHQLPIDGNPFKYLAVRGHPKRLKWMQLTGGPERYAVSYGEGDHAIALWKVNTSPVLDNLRHAGTGLDPFCALLPGGKSGCYVREMLSLFFYNQISPKNSDGDAELTLRDAMETKDVPNYMRSIGFHMSQYEEQNLCKEMELLGTGCLTFEEVVKLFLNHRTSHSPSNEDIRMAVTYLGATVESGTQVDLLKLRELLATIGEPIDDKTADFYCKVLFPAVQSMDDTVKNDTDVANSDCEEQQRLHLISIDEFTERLG
ncbi:cilia- and flagella-associated protein 251-like [Anopheles aquasalis]|uniref:cilia- and flagella-associated protein 251-like n=1 Tax=Anopheles aquasalis TaxID=42839 RepID=UPI00215A6754|nr:cilia- and flagella-associated protein 251-like [Anopheles aquasalis]